MQPCSPLRELYTDWAAVWWMCAVLCRTSQQTPQTCFLVCLDRQSTPRPHTQDCHRGMHTIACKVIHAGMPASLLRGTLHACNLQFARTQACLLPRADLPAQSTHTRSPVGPNTQKSTYKRSRAWVHACTLGDANACPNSQRLGRSHYEILQQCLHTRTWSRAS